MLTTANFPDVMIPAFIKHRAVGLVFFPAVVVGVFVLMNVSTDSLPLFAIRKYEKAHQESCLLVDTVIL